MSYFIAYTVTRILDFLSSKTNGAFGWHKPHEDIDGPEARTTTFRIHGADGAASGSDDSIDSDTQANKVRSPVLHDTASALWAPKGQQHSRSRLCA